MPDIIIQHKQQPINGTPNGLKHRKKLSIGQVWGWAGGIVTTLVVGLAFIAVIWYNIQMSPIGSDISLLKKITINPGTTSSQISQELQKQSIIRNATAFDIYVRLSGKNNILKAGTYRLSPAESTSQIVEHFVKGSVDQFSITFYPGATLTDTYTKTGKKKYDVTTVLEKAGYSSQEIKTALNQIYVSPLFAGKPTGADLEGYVYGETYNFNTGATVRDILEMTFKEFYSVVQKNDLVSKFATHGLNLYRGITLASIVQRESGGSNDQKQIAQVFYSRLSLGMSLGSDVTYQYIADKNGVARDPNLDSVYNTRKVTGLPPGPISVPGLTALQAVAGPASGNYLYFLSGDDNITYFARTDAEHQANIANHCKVKCSTP